MAPGRTKLLTALLLAGGISPAMAGVGMDEKGELLELLDQQTRIATKTRLNADYVPGILTVLQGEDLENRGVRTVWEALELVPGFSVAVDTVGHKQLIVRGIGKVYSSGNVKLLLNGVAVNNETYGLAEPVLNIAIEQVERIEVIRGPGSAIYGQFAYAGVLNIITRTERSRLFAHGGSFNTRGGGAVFSSESASGEWRASLNFAYGESDGADSEVPRDGLYAQTPSLADYSYAPGTANEVRHDGTGILKVSRGGLSLLGQWSETGLGDHFGVNGVLPPPDSGLVERNSIRNAELRQDVQGENWEASFYLGQNEFERRKDDIYGGPAAFYDGTYSDPSMPIYIDLQVQESRKYAGLDMHWRGLSRHGLLLSVGHSAVRIEESYLAYNLTPNSQPTHTTVRYPGYPAEGAQRSTTSVTLQDEYRASEAFTLTAGLRYDDYSDVGSRTTPRVAAVWRVSDRHILKAQYARAFRPPTLYEMGINEASGSTTDTDIEAATIDTGEIGYIYKGDRHDARLTVYHSELDSLILFQPGGFFANDDRAQTTGVEVEYSGRLSRRFELDGNAAYSHTEDETAGGESIAGAPRWTANLGLRYRILPRVTVVLQHRAVGPYSREAQDQRDETDPYQTTDLTLNLENIAGGGTSMRLGVKNVQDSDVRHPAPVIVYGGQSSVAYPDDLPQPGRQWWLQLGYAF